MQSNDPFQALQDAQYLKVSYQDLLQATNKFSANNLVGEGIYGSVYKGFLKSVEHIDIVAVKVLNVEVHGANKSFLAEYEMLRNIRRRNLIKIITACSSTDYKGNDFKALVFEFMTNGSLDNWLHPSPYYQEYGVCEETEGDAYSYGILVLEMFTGRRPTENNIIDGATDLHDYVRKALPQRVMDIADPRIVTDQGEHGSTGNQSYNRAIMEECMSSIFEVGILCSEETPRKRLDISVAIKQLQDKLRQHKH